MSDSVTRYVRYAHEGGVSYGILDGETIKEIAGGLFGERAPTGKTVQLGDVKLRYPCEPSKVLCVGLNYLSHLGDHPAPTNPEIFYKPPTALTDPGDDIVFPPGARDVHYEAELVVVIGKTAKGISAEDADDHIFGYTCGNDVSDRNWQLGSLGDPKDLQWWRAKGSDTFGPLGPAIAVGLDYEKSKIELRLNGEVKQSQFASDLIFGPRELVSFISHYVTLSPGDVIYSGTPGSTSPMKPGDEVEVEIGGVGILRNQVAG